MKKLISPIILFAFLISCSSKDKCTSRTDGTVPASEVAQIEEYLKKNNISNAIKDPRGFYYIIKTPGTGTKPTLQNTVYVYYVGKFVDGTKFDESTDKYVGLDLRSVIVGWQYGIPLIAPGGEITLFLPPSLSYGCNGSGPVPPGAMLIFDVALVYTKLT